MLCFAQFPSSSKQSSFCPTLSGEHFDAMKSVTKDLQSLCIECHERAVRSDDRFEQKRAISGT